MLNWLLKRALHEAHLQVNRPQWCGKHEVLHDALQVEHDHLYSGWGNQPLRWRWRWYLQLRAAILFTTEDPHWRGK